MAGVLQERVEPELAVPRRFRHHWLRHHQVHRRAHRGGRQELAIRSRAQPELKSLTPEVIVQLGEAHPIPVHIPKAVVD